MRNHSPRRISRVSIAFSTPVHVDRKLCVSRAHGFLTAAVACPGDLDDAEWLRLIFDEPIFASGDEGGEMLGLAVRLYRDIERSLGEEGRFRPVLEFRDEGPGRRADASDWCTGFVSGFRLFPEHWHRQALDTLQEPSASSCIARIRGCGGAIRDLLRRASAGRGGRLPLLARGSCRSSRRLGACK